MADWSLDSILGSFTPQNVLPSAVLVGMQAIAGSLQDKWKQQSAEDLQQQQYQYLQQMQDQKLAQELKVAEMLAALEAKKSKMEGFLTAGGLGVGGANSTNAAITNFLRGIGQ